MIHHIALRSPHPFELVKFYERVFALSRVREQSGYSVWLKTGSTLLMIEKAGEGELGPPTGGMDLIAFAVSERERHETKERLRSVGVVIENETEHTTYFRDPEGRRLGVSTYLFQRE